MPIRVRNIGQIDPRPRDYWARRLRAAPASVSRCPTIIMWCARADVRRASRWRTRCS